LAVVRQKALEIIAKVVVERGANIALDKNFVIYIRTDQNLDVTKEVLARLNTEIPDVTVEMVAE
jgi:Skp family chaperone for outer membrane proteins